jgi:hypothetical protein
MDKDLGLPSNGINVATSIFCKLNHWKGEEGTESFRCNIRYVRISTGDSAEAFPAKPVNPFRRYRLGYAPFLLLRYGMSIRGRYRGNRIWVRDELRRSYRNKTGKSVNDLFQLVFMVFSYLELARRYVLVKLEPHANFIGMKGSIPMSNPLPDTVLQVGNN